MSGQDWTKAFITWLLSITHGQWMCHNFSLHNKTLGHLQLTHQANMLTEIAQLVESKPEDIPPMSRFLLEVKIMNLETWTIAQQEYWMKDMKAALKAGSQRQHRSYWNASNIAGKIPGTSSTAKFVSIAAAYWALEHELRADLNLQFGSWRNKCPHSGENNTKNGSNKRFRKPDWDTYHQKHSN